MHRAETGAVSSSAQAAVLLISCPDRPGIVAAVTAFIADHGGNIIDLEQHADEESCAFFMRLEWDRRAFNLPLEEITAAFAPIAARFEMAWEVRRRDLPARMAIFVTRESHCLIELLALGHRRIACLSSLERPHEEWAIRRRTAFERAVKKHKDIRVRTWRSGDDAEAVVDTARALLADPLRPTAVFCVTDLKASLLYRAAAELNLPIPEALSVIGFSDIDFARTLAPPLTTVRQDPIRIGREAAALLLDRIEGRGSARPRGVLRIACELVVRQSTGPAR